MSQQAEIPVVQSHNDVETPFSSTYDRVYILALDQGLYAKKSDGTYYLITPAGGGGGGSASIVFNRTYLQMQPNATISDTFASALPAGKIPLAYRIINTVPFVCGIDPAMTASLTLLNTAAEQMSGSHSLVAATNASGSVNQVNDTSNGLIARFLMSAGTQAGSITLQITGAITVPQWRPDDNLVSTLGNDPSARLDTITQTAPGVYDVVLKDVVEGAQTWLEAFNAGQDLVNQNAGEQALITGYSQVPGTPTTIDDLTAGEYSVEVWYL